MEDLKFRKRIFVCVAMFIIGVLISFNVFQTSDTGSYEVVDDVQWSDVEALGTNFLNDTGIGIEDIGAEADGSFLPFYNANGIPIANGTFSVTNGTFSTNRTPELNQNGFTFDLDNILQTATITGYNSVGGFVIDLVIPDEVVYNNKVYSVTAIGDYAITGISSRNVYIPDSVLYIGSYAFYESNIREVYIPESVTHIGDSAFYNSGLNEVLIGNYVTHIGDSAFARNYLTEIHIPHSVTSIGNFAFAGNQLELIGLGSVEIIGDYAFALNQIAGISIPNSVTYIGDSAFVSNQLMSVTIGNYVTHIGVSAFADNQLEWAVIGNSVDRIGSSTFADNQLIWTIIGNSVEIIDSLAFAGNQLSSVTIPNSVVTIGQGAFEGNQIAGRLSIPNSVTAIHDGAFANNQIETITFGDSLSYIGDRNDWHIGGCALSLRFCGVFENNQIINVSIPDSVEHIGASAFQHNLLTNVDFSDSVATIGEAAFADNQLTHVRIPSTVTFPSGNNWHDSTTELTMNMSSAFSGNQLQIIYIDEGDATRLKPLIGVCLLNTTGIPTIISEDGSRYESDVELYNDVEVGDDLAFEVFSQIRYVFNNELRLEGLQSGLWSDHQPTVQWYRNGEPLSGETYLTINLTDIQIDDEGEYFAIIDGEQLPTITVTVIGDRIITELSIDDIAGVIDQEAETITFIVPEDLIDDDDQFRGYITELEAISNTIIFYASGEDLSLGLGESAGVSTDDTVRVDGGIVYTIIIEHPETPIIESLSIGDVVGEIDQEAETITFIVPEDSVDEYSQFRDYITELEASADTIIFYADGEDLTLGLGESAGVSTDDTVRVDGGIVYTIIIEHPEVLIITNLSIDDIVGEIDQEAETITFTVPEDLIDEYDQFRGYISELEASADTIIFFVGAQELPLALGDEVGVSTEDLVYIDTGIVYTIIVYSYEEPAVAELAEELTESPTDAPTESPTDAPTAAPTDAPTAAPTAPPTAAPTAPSTAAPTAPPTATPTAPPTTAPPAVAPTVPVVANVSNWTASQWRDYLNQYRSSTLLPNRRVTDAERTNWIADYNRSGHTAFDLEVVRLVNQVRANHGLSSLTIDNTLMMAARFYSQTMSNFNTPLGHNQGPYRISGASHGASQNIAEAFGARLRWNGGNAAAHARGQKHTPQSLVNAWMNSPGHSAYILSPEHRFIGSGSYLGGSGSPWGVYYYMFLND